MGTSLAMITKADFFKSTYRVYSAKVIARKFSSITYRICGKVCISAAGQTILSGPGSLTFLPAGCPYETTVLETGEMLVLHYMITPGTQDISDIPFTLPVSHADTIIQLLTNGIRHFEHDGLTYDTLADAYRLLAEVQRILHPALLPYKKLCKLRKYIDQNLQNTNLRVSTLAQQFGSSQVYFRREFKKYYGLSPSEYLKKRRLEIASQLLRTKLYTVTEVATKAGFDSISYFSSEFRRHFGCSPREYKDF